MLESGPSNLFEVVYPAALYGDKVVVFVNIISLLQQRVNAT
jgi:hypothetical protein